MDRRSKILIDEFNPVTEDGRDWDEDLRLAIAVNPDVAKIKNAMDENGKQMCLDLLEYMAKYKVRCAEGAKEAGFWFKGEWISKEQLFENFS